jgi:hypothetical protein
LADLNNQGINMQARYSKIKTFAGLMVLREYSPGPAVLNGGWLPPKIEKVK